MLKSMNEIIKNGRKNEFDNSYEVKKYIEYVEKDDEELGFLYDDEERIVDSGVFKALMAFVVSFILAFILGGVINGFVGFASVVKFIFLKNWIFGGIFITSIISSMIAIIRDLVVFKDEETYYKFKSKSLNKIYNKLRSKELRRGVDLEKEINDPRRKIIKKTTVSKPQNNRVTNVKKETPKMYSQEELDNLLNAIGSLSESDIANLFAQTNETSGPVLKKTYNG